MRQGHGRTDDGCTEDVRLIERPDGPVLAPSGGHCGGNGDTFSDRCQSVDVDIWDGKVLNFTLGQQM